MISEDSIRYKVSKLLGVRISEGQWDETLRELEVAGMLDMKIAFRLIILLCKEIEKHETSTISGE